MTDQTASPRARERAPESTLASRVQGTVRIVGAGLLGPSIGHALSARGIDVALDDTSPGQLRLAVDYGRVSNRMSGSFRPAGKAGVKRVFRLSPQTM